MAGKVTDVNILGNVPLPTPEALIAEVARSDAQADFVLQSRAAIHDILVGADRRLLVVIGPCSIHDVEAGREYARRLKELADRYADRLYIVMRVYFEKPRTTVGWKGLIMDPQLDGSCDIPAGLRLAREFLIEVLETGLPTATELLDPITPQYIAGLISWSAIGARTTESQTHRQMASGLSMPVGFKNGTAGQLDVAINAIKAGTQPQTFLGVSHTGQASAVTTKGNPDCHIILRGGANGPNYSEAHVAETEALLKKHGLLPSIMVDASHANSEKDPARQPAVIAEVLRQIAAGRDSLTGVMVESNLVEGAQKFPQPKEALTYGQSITDPCIGWETTEKLLADLHAGMAPRFA